MDAAVPADGTPKLHFIRHGETEWSLSGRHTGRTDLPLTAHGEDQARKLGVRLGGLPFSRVLTSPRQRAWRTCELAALVPLAEIDPDLAEWDYGAYEGQRTVEIWQQRPGWNLFRDGCPGGEMPAQVSHRADRVIASLGDARGNIALFSHGQFGCVLAARWIGMPVIEAQHFLIGAASLSILGYNPSHPEVRVISSWNDAR